MNVRRSGALPRIGLRTEHPLKAVVERVVLVVPAVLLEVNGVGVFQVCFVGVLSADGLRAAADVAFDPVVRARLDGVGKEDFIVVPRLASF